MANARTNQLHDKLPVELRQAVERDLVEQPPGRATYDEVYKYHDLAAHGVSLKAVQRYGGYLRTIKRNQWIRDFGDVLVGEDLSERNEGLVRSRLFEVLTSGEEFKIGDLWKAAMAEKTLRDSVINVEAERRAQEQWEQKKAQAIKALEASEKRAVDDPAKALDRLQEDIRHIYGIEG